MTHSPHPLIAPVTVAARTPDPVPVRPSGAVADEVLAGEEARLMAGLATATSLAGAASATWAAIRALQHHRRVTNRHAA